MTACNTAIAQVDLTKVKPYGDTLNDGMVELAFTLPVPYGEEGSEAAKILAKKMGLDEPNVVYSKNMTDGYTFFVVYGKCQHTVDYTTIKVTKVEVISWTDWNALSTSRTTSREKLLSLVHQQVQTLIQ